MKKKKPDTQELKEIKQANKAFDLLVAFGKKKDALISVEIIKRDQPTLFDNQTKKIDYDTTTNTNV